MNVKETGKIANLIEARGNSARIAQTRIKNLIALIETDNVRFSKNVLIDELKRIEELINGS